MTVTADQRVPASARWATELMFVSSTNVGPVKVGWPPPITFLLMKYSQRIDRKIALQERLLIDGPCDHSVLDRVDHACVGVERRDPRVTVHLRDRLQRGQCHWRTEGQDAV